MGLISLLGPTGATWQNSAKFRGRPGSGPAGLRARLSILSRADPRPRAGCSDLSNPQYLHLKWGHKGSYFVERGKNYARLNACSKCLARGSLPFSISPRRSRWKGGLEPSGSDVEPQGETRTAASRGSEGGGAAREGGSVVLPTLAAVLRSRRPGRLGASIRLALSDLPRDRG